MEFSSDEFFKALRSLRSSSAAGFVAIETRVLKECAFELKYCLRDLLNLCLSTGSVPDEWKVAFLTPFYEGKSSKSSLDNYRPISILSPISKIFESFLSTQIRHFFESNLIFSPSQYGFRKFLSSEFALNSILDRWKIALDDRKYLIAIFLDLSKAFDTIDHELLLSKLSFSGFSNLAILLIRSYLLNRFSITTFDGARSKQEALKVSVPQGSVLGPLRFIIFINDMCHQT